MIHASYSGEPNVVQLLVRHGANVNFADTLGMIYNRVADKSRFLALIEQLSPESLIWQEDHFTAAAAKLPAKVLDGFFTATLVVKGKDWFLANATSLPLKFWAAIERCLELFIGILHISDGSTLSVH